MGRISFPTLKLVIERFLHGRLGDNMQWGNYVLELMAGMFAIQTFTKNNRDIHIHLRMDKKKRLDF